MNCFRYTLQYTVTDSEGNTATPMQLEVDLYELGTVTGTVLLIGRAADLTQAQLQAQLLQNSSSAGNAALRNVTAAALSTWLTSIVPSDSVAAAAASVFGMVDAFVYSAVYSSQVAVPNITLVSDLQAYALNDTNSISSASSSSSGINYGLLVQLQINVSSTAYATAVSSSSTTGNRRRLSQSSASGAIIFALQLKLQLIAAALQGVSVCSSPSVVTNFYNNNAPPYLSALCANSSSVTAYSGLNLNSYFALQTYSATAPLPLYQVLSLTQQPSIAQITATVDANLAATAAATGSVQEIIASQTLFLQTMTMLYQNLTAAAFLSTDSTQQQSISSVGQSQEDAISAIADQLGEFTAAFYGSDSSFSFTSVPVRD